MTRGKAMQYSHDEEAWLSDNRWLERGSLHAQFVEKFNRPDVTAQNLHAYRMRRGWKKGKADNSANLKHFSKGYKPWNRAEHGDERISSKGVREVRTESGWVSKARILWEARFGAVPSGMVLKAIDGDRDNLDPMNWRPITRRVLSILNVGHGRTIASFADLPKDVRPCVVGLAELKSSIIEAELKVLEGSKQ